MDNSKRATDNVPVQKPYFAIQIFSVGAKLKTTDPRLRGLKEIRFVEAAGRYKVIHGHFADYATARSRLEEIRKQFPDAFIVAFSGEQQISTAEAIQTLRTTRE